MIAKLLPIPFALALMLHLSAAEPTAEIDARLAELTKAHPVAVAALVSCDGKILYEKAVGLADAEHKLAATPATKFRIGSITKQFTAAAILRLAEQGKLSIEDPLTKFFPDFPGGEKINVRMLLTHTSGLHSYTGKPSFLKDVTAPIAPEKLIASFRDDPPDFAPGASWSYCNSGYFLLGEIVAKVSGKTFADCLREQFFEPLGMKDTGIFRNDAPPAGTALGYSFADGKLTRALDWDMSWAGGAGALYSTVGDLHRWNEAVFNGRILSAVSLKAAHTPVALPPGVQGLKYGFGWAIGDMRGLPMIDHGGGLHGFQSYLVRFPGQKLTVVVLANAEAAPPGIVSTALGREIAAKFLAAELPPAPTVDSKIDPKTFASYAGEYDYGTAVMTITAEADHLFAQLAGQPRFEIFPSAPDHFFWKAVDAQVVFSRGEKGEVTAAEHHQGGTSFKAPKLPPSPKIQLADAVLETFTGQYDYGSGAVLTVTRDGSQLSAQLTGQPKFPIYPKSATEFVWRVVPARVVFTKGADGKVTKATHHQGGATFDAAKIK
jgi:CubicO group peptidase (beta-lactamase class C family)